MFTSAFFQTLGYAIPALIAVGASWCLIGLVMGSCPKHNIPSAAVQQVGAWVAVIVSLIIMVTTRQWVTAPWKPFLLITLCYALGGAVDFFMLQFMSLSMQRGPNGVIWSIIQSALIFPFIGGVFFFGQTACGIQWIGVLSIIIALFLFGTSKNNTIHYQYKNGEFHWRTLAFCAFACAATQQNLTTAPSYFAVTEGVPSIVRTMATSSGALLGYLGFQLFHHKTPEEREAFRSCYKRLLFWKYIVVVQGFRLLAAYLLLFPGIDIMAKHGLGYAAYPMMVGSCIIAFILTAIIQLKERLTLSQILGLIFCCAGLLGICLK